MPPYRLMAMVRGLLSVLFGMASVSTPSRKDASIFSASASAGSVKLRLKLPKRRST